MDNPTLAPRLYRLDRRVDFADLASGAATVVLPEIPAGSLAELEQVTVSGATLGGARVSLYYGNDDQSVRPENLIGTAQLGPTDPGTSFGNTRPWIFGPERLIVVVAGAGDGRVAVRVWQRIFAVEYVAPTPPAREVPATAETAEDGGK